MQNDVNKTWPNLWNNPHATTSGALWITDSGQTTMLAQDVNLRLEVDSPYGNGGYAWTTLVTLLLSAPSGQVADASNGWIGDANDDNTFWGDAVSFADPAGQTYAIPHTSWSTGPSGSYAMRLYAWTGAASNYADAAAQNQYIAATGVFNQAVSYGGPMPTAAGADKPAGHDPCARVSLRTPTGTTR